MGNDMDNNKKLRHVVLFGFGDDISAEQIQELINAFGMLSKKINLVKDYEYGVDCSPEGKQNGLTHCFILTFDSEEDRDAYLIHRVHTEFSRYAEGIVDKVTVVDYYAET
jgi:hypothetical protein